MTSTATQIHVLSGIGFATKPSNLSPKPFFFNQALTKTAAQYGGRFELIAVTTTTTARARSSRFAVLAAAKGNPVGEEKWTEEGSITESLPNGMFRVKLDNQGVIIGYISGKIRKNFIRIMPGDRVRVEMGRYDSSRGRIVFRYRNRDPNSSE
nr:chloroplast translation initiation factor 1 [Viola ulleungdoensis]